MIPDFLGNYSRTSRLVAFFRTFALIIHYGVATASATAQWPCALYIKIFLAPHRNSDPTKPVCDGHVLFLKKISTPQCTVERNVTLTVSV